ILSGGNDPLAPYFMKFVIPARAKANIRQQLRQIGITHYTIYPDLDGISQKLNWETQMDIWGDWKESL
ncbi:MAG: hypothetical protein JXA10_08585, partial [Anaerolineae bacterium]|nr:hypothetical protein [Anaerolineae bacterium]